jgi:predicted PhzF superfamily epimerase YddE/YHI9
VDICGHATLATAHVLFSLPSTASVTSFTFDTISGTLRAAKTEDGLLELDFPADDVVVIQGEEREKIAAAAVKAMRGKGQVKEVYLGSFYLAIEVTMNEGVNLAAVEVEHNALVSNNRVSSFCSGLSRQVARGSWSRRNSHHRDRKLRGPTLPFAIPSSWRDDPRG